jgi:hypothetical protein
MLPDTPRRRSKVGATGSATPGKPKDSGSRQQTGRDQNSQTGSAQTDKEMTGRAGAPTKNTRPQ